GRALGDPASAQPADGPLGAGAADPLPRPRPRREGHALLRRCLSRRGPLGDQDTGASAAGEGARRALGRQPAPKVSRLAADLRPPPARAGRPPLHRPPQRPPAAPPPRPAAAAREAATAGAAAAEGDPAARPDWRPAPRVSRDRCLITARAP